MKDGDDGGRKQEEGEPTDRQARIIMKGRGAGKSKSLATAFRTK